MKAAVFHKAHEPLTIEDVDIIDPRQGEVLVRTVASGVCHSDMHFVDGAWSMPLAFNAAMAGGAAPCPGKTIADEWASVRGSATMRASCPRCSNAFCTLRRLPAP